MRTRNVLTIALLLVALFSCNNSKKAEEQKSEEQNTQTTEQKQSEEKTESSAAQDLGAPNLENVKISTAKLGAFPFLYPPTGYRYGSGKEIDERDIRSFDKEYFAVDGKLYLVEGKSFTATLDVDGSENKGEFNSLLVEKSYDKAIAALGGVKVNDGAVPRSELDRVKTLAGKYARDYTSSLNLDLDDVNTYVIKTADKEIWIQFTLADKVAGYLTILEKGDLEEADIKLVEAE